MAEFDLTDGTNSRIESSLTGAEGKYSAPVSRLERIINGEDIKPLSRIEEVMIDYVKHGGGGGLVSNESYVSYESPYSLALEKGHSDICDGTYDPHKWHWNTSLNELLWTQIPSVMVTEEGVDKWQVWWTGNSSYNAVTNNGIYMSALDTKVISEVRYKMRFGSNMYDIGNHNGRDPWFGLLDSMYFGLITSNDHILKKNTHTRSYYDETSTPKQWKPYAGCEGVLSLENLDVPYCYLVYNCWGHSMTFENIEFVLKEEN